MASSIHGKPETSLFRGGSSVYSLTFDEFHNVLRGGGTNLESMNMEDLLKNIWTAEESQAMAAAMDSGEPLNGGLESQLSMQEPCFMSLPKTLNGKLLEVVQKSVQPQQAGAEVVPSSAAYQRQFMLGEATFEESMTKAGLVREQASMNRMPSNQVLTSQVTPLLTPVLKSSNMHTISPNRPENQALHIQTPSSADLAPNLASSQIIAPSNLVQAPQQRATPHFAFGAFAGNSTSFPVLKDDSINQTEKHRDACAVTKSPLQTTSKTLASPDGKRFDCHTNINSLEQSGNWVTKSPGFPFGGTKSPGLSVTCKSHPTPQSMQRQDVLETTPYFERILPSNLGPLLEADASRISSLGGGLGSNVGIGATGMGLGVNLSSTSISFGAGSPLSPAFDEGSLGLNNFSISMIPEFGKGYQPKRKRLAEPPLERLIERRQKRMIKNRESAARSRARKLAYTVELEAEVSQLKEENMRLLRKQEEEFARRRCQMLTFLPARVSGVKYGGRSLERTRTLPW